MQKLTNGFKWVDVSNKDDWANKIMMMRTWDIGLRLTWIILTINMNNKIVSPLHLNILRKKIFLTIIEGWLRC